MRLKSLGGVAFSIFFGVMFFSKVFLNAINVEDGYSTGDMIVAMLLGIGFFWFASQMFKKYKRLAKQDNASLILDILFVVGIPIIVFVFYYIV